MASKIRLYAIDDAALEELKERTGMPKVEIIRRATHAGLWLMNNELEQEENHAP